MNAKGFGILVNLAAFICAVLLAALTVVIADPVMDAMLDTMGAAAPENGSARMIIFGSALVIILGGMWFLTRPEGQLGFNL